MMLRDAWYAIRLFLRQQTLCRFGRHSGSCVDGAFRCWYCDHIDPYYPGSDERCICDQTLNPADCPRCARRMGL